MDATMCTGRNHAGTRGEIFAQAGAGDQSSPAYPMDGEGNGVFVPLVREVGEMLYQWDEPFVISDRRFREWFRREPAAVDEAATATVHGLSSITRRLVAASPPNKCEVKPTNFF
jgi:hypothetical protein